MDIAKRLGTVPYTLSEWRKMLNKSGAINIWDEDWSGIKNIIKIRPDRKITKGSDLFSLWEKTTIIFPRVIKRFGLKGLFYINNSQKKITSLYSNETLGYCLVRGQKPAKKEG